MPSSTPAPGPKGMSFPFRVPTDFMLEHGYASQCKDRFGRPIPGIGVGDTSEDAMMFHYLTGKRAPENFPEGSIGAAQFTYKSGKAADRAERIAALAADELEEAA